jgi:hypothetical protein
MAGMKRRRNNLAASYVDVAFYIQRDAARRLNRGIDAKT